MHKPPVFDASPVPLTATQLITPNWHSLVLDALPVPSAATQATLHGSRPPHVLLPVVVFEARPAPSGPPVVIATQLTPKPASHE
jgi:hypothetical protein